MLSKGVKIEIAWEEEIRGNPEYYITRDDY